MARARGRDGTTAALAVARTVVYKGALAPVSVLPAPLAAPLARRVGAMNHRRQRGSLRVNPDLQKALGASEAEMARLLRWAVAAQTRTDIEASLYGRLRPADLARHVELRGLDRLRAALDGGRGAILFSGHSHSQYATFAALGAADVGAHVVGHPPLYGFNPAESWFARRRFEAIERRFGCRFLWMQEGNFGVAVKAANVLRANGVIVMLIDKSWTERRVTAEFLGRPTRFPPGPALLAASARAPMLHVGMYRDEATGRHVAEIGEPFGAAATVDMTTQWCAAELERHVLRHPADWNLAWVTAKVWGRDRAEWMRPEGAPSDRARAY